MPEAPRLQPPTKLRKLLSLYSRLYLSVGMREAGEVMPAADNYDTWFRTEGVRAIEALVVVRRGRWTTEGSDPNAGVKAGRLVAEAAARFIVDPVTRWSVAHFPEFWRAGWQLWRLNREMFYLPTPRRVAFLEPEIAQVNGYTRGEVAAWQDHVERHRRHVERFVLAALTQGWTTEQFVANMTARDGHIVGFRYGNADLSWHEHLRRYTRGRARMLAQAALEWRTRNSRG